jgi:hypothetical protein
MCQRMQQATGNGASKTVLGTVAPPTMQETATRLAPTDVTLHYNALHSTTNIAGNNMHVVQHPLTFH